MVVPPKPNPIPMRLTEGTLQKVGDFFWTFDSIHGRALMFALPAGPGLGTFRSFSPHRCRMRPKDQKKETEDGLFQCIGTEQAPTLVEPIQADQWTWRVEDGKLIRQ